MQARMVVGEASNGISRRLEIFPWVFISHAWRSIRRGRMDQELPTQLLPAVSHFISASSTSASRISYVGVAVVLFFAGGCRAFPAVRAPERKAGRMKAEKEARMNLTAGAQRS